jgi:hypothetical protein
MKLPSFEEFKNDRATYYAFATIIALITIFGLWQRNQEKQLLDCQNHSQLLEAKVDLLHEKIIKIIDKNNLKDSIK